MKAIKTLAYESLMQSIFHQPYPKTKPAKTPAITKTNPYPMNDLNIGKINPKPDQRSLKPLPSFNTLTTFRKRATSKPVRVDCNLISHSSQPGCTNPGTQTCKRIRAMSAAPKPRKIYTLIAAMSKPVRGRFLWLLLRCRRCCEWVVTSRRWGDVGGTDSGSNRHCDAALWCGVEGGCGTCGEG